MNKDACKAGFVTIIGAPNVGKSTLINRLLNYKLAITNQKAQTTRHNMHGIVTSDNYQIIYTDTPGFIQPIYPLQEAMMEALRAAKKDADIILWVLDTKQLHTFSLDQIKDLSQSVIFVLNKVDLLTPTQRQKAITLWHAYHPHTILVPISAKKNINIHILVDKIVEYLPEHPYYYPVDMLTDRSERFFVQEIIREKILDLYQQEIPYCVEVVVDHFKESEQLVKIETTIYVERQSQKAILIGRHGGALRQLGTDANTALEQFFRKKISLRQHIKVITNWRKNYNLLKKFGYNCSPRHSHPHQSKALKPIDKVLKQSNDENKARCSKKNEDHHGL